LLSFDCKLTSMPGIGIAVASKLIAEIGDIRRFSNADKLARYAGVAPVKFSSAGKGKEQSSRQKPSIAWIVLFPCSYNGVCTEVRNPNSSGMVSLPKYAAFNQEDIMIELTNQAYFSKGNGTYYFRVTEEQFNALTKDYYEAAKLSRENIKEVTFTYDELFSDF
jgi:hypothetical protein